MRTAIYVTQQTLVTIQPTDPGDAAARLVRYPQTPEAMGSLARGRHVLPPGIYLILSRGALDIQGTGVTTETVAKDKDPWPDPKPAVLTLETGATTSSLRAFFDVAKSASTDA